MFGEFRNMTCCCGDDCSGDDNLDGGGDDDKTIPLDEASLGDDSRDDCFRGPPGPFARK